MTVSNINLLFKTARQLGFSQLMNYALYKAGVQTGYYKRVEIGGIKTGHLLPTHLLSNHLFSLPNSEQLKKILEEHDQHTLIAQANEIVSGKIRLFGGDPVELKLTIESPLHHWTDYETNPQLLSYIDAPVSDIKDVWEPARFGWAFILGRAFRLKQNETYVETFWEYFEQFIESNPAYLGPHWMNGQEVALRLMALIWAYQAFEKAASSSVERRARLATSVAQHATRIPPTLCYARAQNNNHLVTEAAGLYTAGLALPDHPRASKWRALGWRWLNWAFQNQISNSGEYIQHSFNYHRVMLGSALWVHAIKDREWPGQTLRSLRRATHRLLSLLDPASGRTPNLGANDGALILPLSTRPFNDFRPTAQAAARAFLGLGISTGPWDEFSTWLGLNPPEKSYDPQLNLTDRLDGRDSWAYLRTSDFPSRLGHMDQLHLDLWWRGQNIAQDAGTYLYNADLPWDNPLVSSRVHNTVTVDGRDQMTRGGRFMILDWFPAFSKIIIFTNGSVLGCRKGWHQGYRGVLHERTVTVYADDRWLVEDQLTSKSQHTYRLHWLLPDWEWEVEDREQGVEISLRSPAGNFVLDIQTESLKSNSHSLLSLVRAGEVIFGTRDAYSFEGWASPTYGEKLPALSLALEIQNLSNAILLTEFTFQK